jgi:excisionase family DNA binding protein
VFFVGAHPQHVKGRHIMRSDIQPESPLLTPAEVAALFRVDPKTVTRWAQQGKLRSIRTLGGHRRYREAEVQAFLERPGTSQAIAR